MTVKELIVFCRTLRPGTPHADETFLEWINELEAVISTEVMLLGLEDVVEHREYTGELLADRAHTKVYWTYICAMIDLANGEYNRYRNDVEVYNGLISDYKIWYANNYNPADGRAETKGYYISAYALAVKHGFSGTEEQWLEYISANAEKALEAQAGAESARDDAQTARDEAQEAAGTAVDARDAAETARTGAENARDEAKASADTATEKAAQAVLSAQAAAADAEKAGVSAAEAAQGAAEAGGSAQAASDAMAAAESASDAARTDREAAEAARDSSETAQAAAEAAQSAAEAAQGAAEVSAVSAQADALTAQTAQAGAAQAAAGAARDALDAEDSAKESEAWARGTVDGVPVEPEHPAFENNSKYYMERARKITGGEFATLEEARELAGAAEERARQASTPAVDGLTEEKPEDEDCFPFFDVSEKSYKRTSWSGIKGEYESYVSERLRRFVIIGGTEPAAGPVLWFDTGAGPAERDAVTLWLGSGEATALVAGVSGRDYPVTNVSPRGVREEESVFYIEVS